MILEDTEIQKISDMLNSNIMPDIYTRTKYVLQFNNKLQNKIINLNNPNICYLDVTTFTYNHDVGIICEDFYTRNELHNFTRNEIISKMIDNYLTTL